MNHKHESLQNLDNENQDEIFKELKVLETTSDLIFPVFLCQFKLEIDNDKILEECLELRDLDPKGKRFSNVGGWQSENYNLFTIPRNITPNIQTLAYNAILAATDISGELNYNVEFGPEGCEWWININEKDCYNVAHTHPGCDIIALYYPKINGNDDGDVCFIRTDGAQYQSLYDNNSEHLMYTLKAEEGVLYLMPSHLIHFVKPNLSNDYRVSIAFNIAINK